MSLAVGVHLGPYEIQSLIGAGGMGEVYTRDTRLDRCVAVKVLPADVSVDPERRARFEREAKTIAGLSHPNVLTTHAVEEAEGVPILTMEYVEGRTLTQMVAATHHPVDRRQSGTEALHEVSFLFGRIVPLR